VAEGVVDQVPDRLLQPKPIAVHLLAAVRDQNRAPLDGGPGGESARDRLEQLARRDRLPVEREPPLVRAGENEEILREPGEALHLVEHGAKAVLELGDRPPPPKGDLELGTEERERRAKLVARVRDEATLAREPRLEAVEHRVQRLAEAANLVLGLGNGQPLVRSLGRDLGRSAPHRVDGSKRRRRESVPGERGEEEGERADDEKLRPQARERVGPILE
jgi:hypothetical protein